MLKWWLVRNHTWRSKAGLPPAAPRCLPPAVCCLLLSAYCLDKGKK
jgi:hypothetical protein